MAKRKVIIEPFQDTKKWLCTFNDLMTLLLTFFVLLLSMSTLESKSIKEVQTTLLNALGVMEAGAAREQSIIDKIFRIEEIGRKIKIFRNIMIPREDIVIEEDLAEGDVPPRIDAFKVIKEEGTKPVAVKEEEYIFNQFKELLDKGFLEPGIVVIKRKRGVLLRLADSILFDTGSDTLRPESLAVLKKIAALMKKTHLNILIEGHTDSSPIRTERYPSNWELSVARAVGVTEYLVESCSISPERMAVVGYGDQVPLAPNDTDKNRKKNRRIEVILNES